MKVGTAANSRFTLKVPAADEVWFSTRLRAELIKRELATAAELAVDEAGEAAMAAKAANAARDATSRAAWKKAVKDEAADPARQAATALRFAQQHERLTVQKRELAEKKLKLACDMQAFRRVKSAANALVDGVGPEAAAKFETSGMQASQSKLDAFYDRVEANVSFSYRGLSHPEQLPDA